MIAGIKASIYMRVVKNKSARYTLVFYAGAQLYNFTNDNLSVFNAQVNIILNLLGSTNSSGSSRNRKR